MNRSVPIIVMLVMMFPLGYKNNDRGIDTAVLHPSACDERGPYLSLLLRIIDISTQNCVTMHSLSSNAGMEMSIRNVYVSDVSHVLYKSQFGYLIAGETSANLD